VYCSYGEMTEEGLAAGGEWIGPECRRDLT
jgi:hypothetical protein